MRKKEGNTQDAGKEFLQAVEFVEKEKGIKKEDILAFMEQALNAAYKKNYGIPGKVVINPDTGSIKVFSFKTVVPDEKVGMDYDDLNENPELDENGEPIEVLEFDPEIEITLSDAKKINPDVQVGETIDTEVTPKDFGRVATSTAKQVLTQKLREAERAGAAGREGYAEKKDRQPQINRPLFHAIAFFLERVRPIGSVGSYFHLKIRKFPVVGKSPKDFVPINAPSASFPDKNPSAGEGFSGGEEGSAIAVERARNHSFSINTVQNYLGVVSIVFRICFKFKSFSLKNKIMQNFYSIITKKRAQNYKDAKIPKRQKSTFAERVATGCRKAAAKSETGAGHT